MKDVANGAVERRAFSTLEIKAIDEEAGEIRGIASTPSPDRMDDVVVPEGASFKLPLPLLWQHNHSDPIGHVTRATVTAAGIEVVATVQRGVTAEIDRYWSLIKAGLVRGLSIGFRGLEAEDIDGSWGRKFTKWEWLELSAVTIPANAEASIVNVKHYADRPLSSAEKSAALSADPPVAASGTKGTKPVGVSTPRKPVSLRKGNDMTYAEQIAAFEAKRAANVARMDEIQNAASDRGESKTADEREEFNDLKAEVKTIDDELTDLRDMQAVSVSKAKPASEAKGVEAGSNLRDPRAPAKVKKSENLPKGVAFARIAKVKALAALEHESTRDVAKALYGEDSGAYGFYSKAAVAGANTQTPSWAGDLITDGGAFADFVEYLRPRTILGQFGAGNIPSLRTVPFDTPFVVQTTGGDGYWVGEGKAKPLTKFDVTRQILRPHKVANIAAATDEMLRRASLPADEWIRDQLANALRARLDSDFVNPDKAAVSDVSPASITNGVTPILSSGSSADAIRDDMKALSAAFRAQNDTTSGTVWLMPEGVAEALSFMQNPLGQQEFSGISAEGGTFLGKPVITSEYMPADYEADGTGAPGVTGAVVALVKAQDIYFADEGGVSVDFSREASLEMNDAPTANGITGSGSSMVSMWQNNMVAFRAERILSWMKRRDQAVAVLGNVNWG